VQRVTHDQTLRELGAQAGVEEAESGGLECELERRAQLGERRRHSAEERRLDARPQLHQLEPSRPIGAEAGRGLGRRAGEDRHRPVGRRVCEDEWPVPPCDVDPERAKDRGSGGEWVEGAVAIVHEAGLDQLAGAHRSAGLVLGFDDEHRPTSIGEHVGGNEPVVARTDHDGVMHGGTVPRRVSQKVRLVAGGNISHKRVATAASGDEIECHKRWYAPHRCSPSDRSSPSPGPAAC
jgi:hypothetical protein